MDKFAFGFSQQSTPLRRIQRQHWGSPLGLIWADLTTTYSEKVNSLGLAVRLTLTLL